MIREVRTPVFIPVYRPSKIDFIQRHHFKMTMCIQDEKNALTRMRKNATRFDKVKKRIEVRGRYYPTIKPRLESKIHFIVCLPRGFIKQDKIATLEKQLDNWTLN
jgi:hypothetical protein